MELAFGIILLVLAVFLVIAVLLQQGKNSGLGAITGGNESYYGQGKTVTKDRVLSRLTTVVAIVFCLVVIVVFMFQGSDTASTVTDDGANSPAATAEATIDVSGTDATEDATAGTDAPATEATAGTTEAAE